MEGGAVMVAEHGLHPETDFTPVIDFVSGVAGMTWFLKKKKEKSLPFL